MINILPSFAVATLADGSMVTHKHTRNPNLREWLSSISVDDGLRKVCTESNMDRDRGVIAALTCDGRILASCSSDRLEFRVMALQRVMPSSSLLAFQPQRFQEGDASDIRDIDVYSQLLVFWSDFMMGFIEICADQDPVRAFCCRFETGIDRVWIDNSRYVIRTKDNRMFRISKAMCLRAASLIGTAPLSLDYKSEIVFHDVENVAEVYGDETWSLFLMKNGTVYACEYGPVRGCKYNSFEMTKPFRPILFPKGESVARIVNVGTHTIYITATNNHYARRITPENNLYVQPVLLEELRGCAIENIHAGPDGSFIVQYYDLQGLSLCTRIVLFNYFTGCWDMSGEMREHSDRRTDDTENVLPRSKGSYLLPALEGRSIVSVIHRRSLVYIVADDGCVFWTWDIEHDQAIITRDTFFDENPLANERGAQSIRSAGSLLEK